MTQQGTVENICLNRHYDLAYTGRIAANQLFHCQDWKDIVDIDTANNSLIGITKGGALLETHFPEDNSSGSIVCDESWGVTHACIVGNDPCSVVFYTNKNELWIKGLYGSSQVEKIDFPTNEQIVKLSGALNTLAALTASGKLFIMTDEQPSNFNVSAFQQEPGTYSDVAVGIPSTYFPVFWCALTR